MMYARKTNNSYTGTDHIISSKDDQLFLFFVLLSGFLAAFLATLLALLRFWLLRFFILHKNQEHANEMKLPTD